VNGSHLWWFILLAENGDAPAPSPLGSMLLPLVAIGVIGYLLLFRPQQKEQAARRQMIEKLKKNDRVVTIGGIYGVVANVNRDSDEVTLKIDESANTRIRVTISAITRVIGPEDANQETKAS